MAQQNRTVVYEINEDPFPISSKFKREIPLNKNVFELNEIEAKNYEKRTSSKQQLSEVSMLDPFQMSNAMTKLLLVDKIIAYLSVFTLVLSIYLVYWSHDNRDLAIVFNNILTILLILLITISHCILVETNKTRNIVDDFTILETIAKVLIAGVNPTIWTYDFNNYLQLIMLIRVIFPLEYYIRSSVYFQSRASRLINIYGIKPEHNFFFAVKVLLNKMTISQVLLMYMSIVVFYSHALFLVREDSFINCFQIVIVTLPTVGFGQYFAEGLDRVIILFILITGVGLNAFVTLSMLKQFQMTTRQTNSYRLMEKLRMLHQIQSLSSQFIIQKIKNKKFHRIKGDERLTDQEFKQKYTQSKIKYRQLSYQQTNYLFNYFKETLAELKIRSQQSDNMIAVLLSNLISLSKDPLQKHKLMKGKVNAWPVYA